MPKTRRHEPSPIREWMTYWTQEIRRLWIPLVSMTLIGYYRRQLDPNSEIARILYKVNILSGAVVLAHMLRSQVFPYIHLSELLKQEDPRPFVGAAILTGLVYLAIVLGFTMGL